MADAIGATVIHRTMGGAAAARAASAFDADDPALERPPAPVVPLEFMRTTLHLVPAMRTALKRRALDCDTTMGKLICTAVRTGLQEPSALALASREHRGVSGGVRTTLDLPRQLHRALKRLAAEEDTSLQALVMAAILGTFPDLA